MNNSKMIENFKIKQKIEKKIYNYVVFDNVFQNMKFDEIEEILINNRMLIENFTLPTETKNCSEWEQCFINNRKKIEMKKNKNIF